MQFCIAVVKESSPGAWSQSRGLSYVREPALGRAFQTGVACVREPGERAQVSKVPGPDEAGLCVRGVHKVTPRFRDSQEDPQAQHIIMFMTTICYLRSIQSTTSKGKRCVGQFREARHKLPECFVSWSHTQHA